MQISERNAIRKIYALPETCTVGDLVKAFEHNPCSLARELIVSEIRAAIYPYQQPQDPEVRAFYLRILNTPCKH